jgi:hypothetical protein
VSDSHRHNAARELERILGEMYPEHTFVVEVEQRERVKPVRRLTVLDGRKPGAVLDDADTLADRHLPPPARGEHDDHLKKSA